MNYKLLGYTLDFSSFLLEKFGAGSDKIKSIILFGSVARNEETKESDIDLFIETDENLSSRLEEIKENFYKSIKVKNYWNALNIKNKISLSVGKLEQWGDLKRSIIANGIVLYGRYFEKPETEQIYLFIVSPTKNRNKNISIWRQIYGYSQKVKGKSYVKLGLLKDLEGRKIAGGAFIVPVQNSSKMIQFLRKASFGFQLIPIWMERKQV